VIDSVREGTPATRAGLQKGDVVVEFDGERARSAQQFTRLVRETAPGRSVKMTVVRDGSRRTLDITPETRDSVTLQQFPQVTADVFRALPRDFDFSFDQRGLWGEGLFGTPRRMGVSIVPLERSTGDVLRGQRRRVGVGGLERHAGSNGRHSGRRCDHLP
jgi:membrane-associated protease RseP (regulator of RpoE activity)